MASLTITATSVAKVSGSVNRTYDAGTTITAGQAVYLDTSGSPSVWRLSQCDGTALEATLGGIALHAASSGQPLAVLETGGVITIGATVAVGTIYVVSATAGSICPWADLVTGNKVSILGYANTSGQLTLNVLNTGVAIP